MGHSTNPERNGTLGARSALTSRLEAGSWDRETLIESTAALDNFDSDVVADALSDLEARGEVYTVKGEVKRTP